MRYVLFLLLMFTYQAGQRLSAQFYQTGQPPASVKWKEIKTCNFRLIYPESYGSQAIRMAGILEESRDLAGHTLNHQPDLIPVVIHSHKARSNGLVVWAPKRMELYPLSPQKSRGGDWLTQLAVHEQRHVVQVDMLKRGITDVLYYILGEQAVGLAAGHLPSWFLEGDAVVTETTLTSSGRGRSASFEMPVRALLQSSRPHYTYDKFVLGSYKDYVPDHYRYGYQMVSSLRREYGPEIWSKTIDYVGRRPVDLFAFGRSLKRQTGKSLISLHEEVISDIRKEWNTLYHPRSLNDPEIINRRNSNLYKSYRYPAWLADTAFITLKSGINQIDEFVILDMTGDEKHIHYPAPLSSPSISVSGNIFAWSEYQPDPRWGLRDYSVIKIFDLYTRKEKRLSSRSRYFAPAFSPDGNILAVIEIKEDNRHFLNFISPVTGEFIESFSVPEKINIQNPLFHTDEDKIFCTSSSSEGMAIIFLDTHTGEWHQVTEPSFVNISALFSCGGKVCFNSDVSGIDEIYALDIEDGSMQSLTRSAYGAFDGGVSDSGEKLIWSEYTADGYDLAMADLDSLIPREYAGETWLRKDLLETLISHERGLVTGDLSHSAQWKPETYKKGLNIFNFHSWSPFYFDYNDFNIEELPVYPGFTLLSQNLLGTANTFVGYSYRNGRHIAHGSFIYKGWYPVFEAGFDYGDRPVVFAGSNADGQPGISDYNLLNINGSTYIPFNFSSGVHIAGVEPLLRISYSNSIYHYQRENAYKRGMTTTYMRFIAYRYLRRSHRDLAPLWGQVLRFYRRSAPFETENLGDINAAELKLYFPGLLPHHSLQFEAIMQRQEPERYYYSNLVSFPRGYSDEKSEQLDLVKSTYSLPLVYPDFSFLRLIYLKRLHANLFFDFGMNRLRDYDSQINSYEWIKEELLSFGGGLTANFHILRIMFPFNMTTGVARIPGRKQTSFLFSFGINLNN